MLNEWIPCKNRVDARNKTKTQKHDATVMHLHATVNKHPFHMFQPTTAEENYSKCITNDEVEEEEEEQEQAEELFDTESDNDEAIEDIALEEIGNSPNFGRLELKWKMFRYFVIKSTGMFMCLVKTLKI